MSQALVIAVDQIEETPSDFELRSDPDWWSEARVQLQEPEAELRAPVAARLQGYRLGERLLFRGRVSGSISLPCSRCVDPYDLSLDEPVELLLEPAPRGVDFGEVGVELDPEDGGLGRYSGERLDFGPVILEILALAWPMKPLCSEACQGLCARCGANRNREACGCASESGNRPFADLAARLRAARGAAGGGSAE